MSKSACNEPAAPENDGTPFVSAYSDTNALAENISFWRGYVNTWKKYAVFKGRSRRKEFWGWIFVNAAIFLPILFACNFLDAVTESDVFFDFMAGAYIVTSAMPYTAVTVRRLHDVGYSGRYVLLFWIPFSVDIIGYLLFAVEESATLETMGGICIFALFILCCSDSRLGVNKFGPNPKGLN
jgi:uncharacterized membrane protein YhaH (DUF805 family)